MAVVLDILYRKMVIVNIYLPPPIQLQVLYDLLVKLAPFLNLPTIFLGDFNAILDPILDSSNTNRPVSMELCTWMSGMGLTELWRWKHPQVKSYSHLSATHRSSARIDLAFGKPSLLKYVHETEYLAGGNFRPLSTFSHQVGPHWGEGGGGWRLSPDTVTVPVWIDRQVIYK